MLEGLDMPWVGDGWVRWMDGWVKLGTSSVKQMVGWVRRADGRVRWVTG